MKKYTNRIHCWFIVGKLCSIYYAAIFIVSEVPKLITFYNEVIMGCGFFSFNQQVYLISVQ